MLYTHAQIGRSPILSTHGKRVMGFTTFGDYLDHQLNHKRRTDTWILRTANF